MARLPPNTRVPENGAVVGSWIVQDRIGSGSHGVVFRVVHAERPDVGSFALKLAKEPSDERFEREAHLLSRIDHPSVPRLEDKGIWTSPRGHRYPYIVMQWVEGVSLYEWAAVHGLTLRQAIGQLVQVARALEATHQHGVHRDVKGSNVRVSDEGHAVLLDFGSCSYPEAPDLTGGAMPPGTNRYRSPQLLLVKFARRRGAKGSYKVQPEDDVYALGVTAYRLLACAYPPRDTGSSSGEGSDPLPLSAPRGLAERCPELGALILRMLSEDPAARGSAEQVAEELERLLKQSSPALDLIWVERSVSEEPTEETGRPTPPSLAALKKWEPHSAVIAAVIALLLWLLPLNVERREVASADGPRNMPPAAGKPDAGSVGTGNEALAAVVPTKTPPDSEGEVSSEMPDEPLPGQKRPPCVKGVEAEIKGGCWLPINGVPPPCHKDWYEYNGRCYAPFLGSNTRRSPTSEDPQ